jgi:hypothetical protein
MVSLYRIKSFPYKIAYILFLLITLSPLFSGCAHSQSNIFMRENFENIEKWKPYTFRSIKRHTLYSVVSNGSGTFLKVESRNSASGIVLRENFNVYHHPFLRWRWKIEGTYQKGDATRKEGDDYPIRIYVIFNDDFLGILSLPHSSLNYIWANRHLDKRIIPSSYTKKSMLVVLEEGSEKAGKWVEEKVDIVNDYRRAFGENPPVNATIGIMGDSDNTGESAISYIDFIEVYGARGGGEPQH